MRLKTCLFFGLLFLVRQSRSDEARIKIRFHRLKGLRWNRTQKTSRFSLNRIELVMSAGHMQKKLSTKVAGTISFAQTNQLDLFDHNNNKALTFQCFWAMAILICDAVWRQGQALGGFFALAAACQCPLHKRALSIISVPITSSPESEEETSLSALGLECAIAADPVFTINWHRQESSRLTVHI